jgi:hypothetical protein
MRPWHLVALFLSLTLLPPDRAAAQAPDATPDIGANAALQYWQAFAVLPALNQDQERLLQEWNKVPLDAAALALIDRSRNSRLYLHRGGKLPRCDWGLDTEDGVGLLLPHCPRSLTLARLAALHARYEFEQGHPGAGWEDVIDLFKLGRQVGRGPQFVVRWVDYRIETMAIAAAAPYLPALKPVLPGAAPAVLEGLPAGPTLAQMVLSEKQVGLKWVIEKMKEAERHKEGSWKDVWKSLFPAPEGQDREVIQSVRTFEQAVRFLEDLLPLYDQLAKVTALPWKEFDAQYPEFVKKAGAAKPLSGFVLPSAAGPLSSFILPPMDRIVARERRYHAQIALFRAALAVVQGGPGRLKDIPDPFGDGPCEYRALGKGFELKSKLLYEGKPVTLTVGQATKE